MFSRRSFVPEGETELSLLQERAPGPWLDLSAANPTAVGLARPDFASILARHDGPYLPDPRGWLPARDAVAALYRDRSLEVSQDDVLLCASTSEAYGYLLMALCDPGDAIAIPEPSYPLFEHLARLHDVEVRPYVLAYDGAWHIDFDSLRRALDPRVRAIFMVSPNNPTGSFLKPAELEQLWKLGVPLVVDEVFRPYVWSSYRGPIAEPLAAPPVLTCVLDGLSKRIGAPELKLGWIACAGPHKEQALRRLEWIADTFLSVGGPVQRALPELLEQGAPLQRALLSRVEQNLHSLVVATSGSPVTPLRGEGGWYAPLHLPAVLDEAGWLEVLLSEGLGPQPGWLFDFALSPVVVLSLLPPKEQFAVAVQKLVAAVVRRAQG